MYNLSGERTISEQQNKNPNYRSGKNKHTSTATLLLVFLPKHMFLIIPYFLCHKLLPKRKSMKMSWQRDRGIKMKGLRVLRVIKASSLCLSHSLHKQSSHSSAITTSAVQLLLKTTAAIIYSKTTTNRWLQTKMRDIKRPRWLLKRKIYIYIYISQGHGVNFI